MSSVSAILQEILRIVCFSAGNITSSVSAFLQEILGVACPQFCKKH
jgi:hypothetical protein